MNQIDSERAEKWLLIQSNDVIAQIMINDYFSVVENLPCL